jgi:hypothetical protein
MSPPPSPLPGTAGGDAPGPERLAALLDGRLDDLERARRLAELARPDGGEARAVLADAAAVLRELEAADAPPTRPVPHR